MGTVVSKPTIELFLQWFLWVLMVFYVFPSGVGAAQPAGGGHRAGVDAPGWGDHVCGGEPHGRGRAAHPHRAAGGRHEGVSPPGHQLAAQQRQEIPAHQRWVGTGAARPLQPAGAALLTHPDTYSPGTCDTQRVSASSATLR